MDPWSSQHYRRKGADENVDAAILKNALAIGREIVRRNPHVQPVFTLKHLAVSSGVEYNLLRQFVKGEKQYKSFAVRKRPGPNDEPRYRMIRVPSAALMKVQRWITRNILANAPPHEASVAFSHGNTLRKAVESHCQSRWLIKLDVRNFFESISENSAYHVFLKLGFEPLISFEMARICTYMHPSPSHDDIHWAISHQIKEYKIAAYKADWRGYLPQGAPSSPMLANLACVKLDGELTKIANRIGLEYTRYADDMTFSTCDESFTRDNAKALIRRVYQILASHGLTPNKSKALIVPPGARKIVLGLLVDGEEPRLTREFKAAIRQHLYYLTHKEFGPVRHANARGFTSILGLRNHLQGLLAFAGQIEPEYAHAQRTAFNGIVWPI